MYEDRKDAIATGMASPHKSDEEQDEDDELEQDADGEGDVGGEMSIANIVVGMKAAKAILEDDNSDTESDVDERGPSRRPSITAAAEGKETVVTVTQYLPDPPAVASMRSLLNKLEDKEESRLMVEIIAETMENLVDAQCGAEQWKKIRCVCSVYR